MSETIKTRLLQAGIGLASILFVGTFGYWAISDFSFNLFDCFYMTVITITTIGYDEKFGTSDFTRARVFTVFLAFAGIGLLTYFVSNISAIIIEGNIKESYKKRRMEKEINNLEDHYIICGISKHSFHLIEELSSTKRESVFIELDKNTIDEVLKKHPREFYVEGDASNDDILLKAGVKKAKGLFAATNVDNMNLVISLSARRLNPDLKIVSLCTDHNNMDKMLMAGASKIVSPNYIGGLRLASEMLRPAVTDFLDSMLRDKNKNLRIEQIDFNEKFEGKKLSDLDLKDYKDTLTIAIRTKNEWLYKPGDDYEIKTGDSLIVITTPDERAKLEEIKA